MKIRAAIACLLFWAVAGEIRGQDHVRHAPKMISIPSATPETNPPSVRINSPKEGERVGEPFIRTLITATDDTRVESFRFWVNGISVNGPQGQWYWAPGMPQPWGISIGLNPGTNTFAVQCSDYWGNMTSASVTFVYGPSSELTLSIANGGQVTPNYRGRSLELGQSYSMTAQPGKGFRFGGWSGSVSNPSPQLSFVMQPNLSFTADFTDVLRPLNIITFPRVNTTVRKNMLIATGKAADNSALANVYYQLNGSGWETAITTNAWRNWETETLSPVHGRNVIESYAVDDSGLPSRTNLVKFRH